MTDDRSSGLRRRLDCDPRAGRQARDLIGGGPLDAAPSAAFLDDAFISETVPALRAEAKRVLATYEIEDPAVLQRIRYGLASIAILQDRPADATSLITAQRTDETKPQLRAIGFLLGDAIAASLHAPRSGPLYDRCRCSQAGRRVETGFGRLFVAMAGRRAGYQATTAFRGPSVCRDFEQVIERPGAGRSGDSWRSGPYASRVR